MRIELYDELAQAMCKLIFPISYVRLRDTVELMEIDEEGNVYLNGESEPRLSIDGITDYLTVEEYIDFAKDQLLYEFSNLSSFESDKGGNDG